MAKKPSVLVSSNRRVCGNLPALVSSDGATRECRLGAQNNLEVVRLIHMSHIEGITYICREMGVLYLSRYCVAI